MKSLLAEALRPSAKAQNSRPLRISYSNRDFWPKIV